MTLNRIPRPAAWHALPLAFLLVPLAAAAQDDVRAGRQKAQACIVCHGPLGISQAPDAPHLAGQPAAYLVAQLKAFRSGARRHEVMNVMARGLSDEDMARLAAWFSSIRVEAVPPP